MGLIAAMRTVIKRRKVWYHHVVLVPPTRLRGADVDELVGEDVFELQRVQQSKSQNCS